LLYLWRRVHNHLIPGDGKIINLLSTLRGPPVHFSETLLGVARPLLVPQSQWAQARMEWDMREEPEPDRPHSIRSETDFQALETGTLEWLGHWSGMSTQKLRCGPDAVVEGLAAVRNRLHLGLFVSRAWNNISRRLRAR